MSRSHAATTSSGAPSRRLRPRSLLRACTGSTADVFLLWMTRVSLALFLAEKDHNLWHAWPLLRLQAGSTANIYLC